MQIKVSYIVIIVLAFVCLVLSMKLGQQSNAAESAKSTTSTEPATVAEKSPVPTVAVLARETKNFYADEYVMSIGLTMLGADKKVLYKKMSDRRARLFEILKSLGIPESSVEQNSVELRKEWSYDDGKSTFLGFRSEQSFSVHVKSRALQRSISQALSKEPELEINNTKAQLNNVSALQAEVVKKACEKAFAKAENYARSAGRKLGRIVVVGGDVDQDKSLKSDSVSVKAYVNLEMEMLARDEKVEPSKKPTLLYVQSDERGKYLADKYVANFRLQMVGKDKEKLYKLMESRGAALLGRLDSLEIPRSNIVDSDIDLRKNMSYSSKRLLGEFYGYAASKRFSVYLKSSETARTLVDLLALDKDVEFDGVVPRLQNEDSLSAEMALVAGKNAMAKANVFATGLGMKVDRVIFANDGNAKRVDPLWRGAVAMDELGDLVFEESSYGFQSLLGGVSGGFGATIADSVDIKARVNYVVELK